MDSDEDGLNSDGTKAEEPKYGISLHKRHKYPGSKGHKATRSKRQKFAVSARGSVAEGPKRTPTGTLVARKFDAFIELFYLGSEDHKATSSNRLNFTFPCPEFVVSAPGRIEPERSAPVVVPGVSHVSGGRPAGKCLICFAEDKHYTMQCPYLDRVPENAVVSSGCDVVCRKCGYTIKGPGKWICCKQEGRAVLKKCEICMTSGEHWSVECPSDEGVDLARTLLTPVENLSCDGVTGPLV